MRVGRTIRAWIVASAVAPLLVGCVTVAEFRKLDRRISKLEGGGAATGGEERTRLADLAAQLDGIEGEIERLNGRLEVAEHRVDEALKEARAARAEASAAAASAAPSESQEGAPPAPDEGAEGTSSRELEAYRAARAAWSEGDAEACIDRFRNFLQTYASSTYAENAAYWMADCYFKRGDYRTAVLRFDDVVVRYPTGKRAPDALYRQGEALLRLGPGYGKAAGKAFERVIEEYPDSARAPEAEKQLELLGSGGAKRGAV
jgi:tol-pal system protein YbgF